MTLCKRWGLITNPLYQMSTVDNDEEGKEGRREGRELDLTESCIAIRRFSKLVFWPYKWASRCSGQIGAEI